VSPTLSLVLEFESGWAFARNARPDRPQEERERRFAAVLDLEGQNTPAASSANADEAAAFVLARRSLADREGLPSLAVIKGQAAHSQEPHWFTTAPIAAIRKLLDKVGWSVGDVDLFEINEAFAVVPMAAARDLGTPREKLNVNGGACALGHPEHGRQDRTGQHGFDAGRAGRRALHLWRPIVAVAGRLQRSGMVSHQPGVAKAK
jgi:hypothetical protein